MYIQLVDDGLLFRRPRVHRHGIEALNEDLAHFRVEVVDVVDVVVSILNRLHQDEMSDIEAMVDRGLVNHDVLVARFREDVDFTMDAKADDVPRARANLHRIE